METLTFSDRIGVSTLCLRGIPLIEAIDQVLEAGFSAFEITPITYGGPEVFAQEEREDLRRRLEAYELVTVHSSGMDGANICSEDSAHRKQSRQRYLALATFAEDVGADVLTFHPGRKGSEGSSEEAVRTENIAFGKVLFETVGSAKMKLGYELFDASIAPKIGSPNFGVLFDIGHASLRGPEVDTDDVIEMVDELAGQIVQFHIHGVGNPGKTDHLPLSENTWLDYDRITGHIGHIGFSGPLILEIGIRTEEWAQNLKDCVAARDVLIQAAEEKG